MCNHTVDESFNNIEYSYYLTQKNRIHNNNNFINRKKNVFVRLFDSVHFLNENNNMRFADRHRKIQQISRTSLIDIVVCALCHIKARYAFASFIGQLLNERKFFVYSPFIFGTFCLSLLEFGEMFMPCRIEYYIKAKMWLLSR